MLTDTLLGRSLLWRAPRWGDFNRFPSEPAGADPGVGPPKVSRQIIDPERVSVRSYGRFPKMTLASLLSATDTVALIALREGSAVFDWRRAGSNVGELGRNLSVTKSIGWAVIGRALDERDISPDCRIGSLLPQIADPAVRELTIAQLMRMSSGIRYKEGPFPWTDDARVYHGVNLRRAALRVHVSDPVDAFFHYNDWHPLLLAIALERITGRRTAELFRDLWEQIGAGAATMTTDQRGFDGLAHMESGFNTTAEGLALFGQLILGKGVWQDKRLIPARWMTRLFSPESSWQTADAFRYYANRPWGRPLLTGHYQYKDFWWHYLPSTNIHDLFAMGALGAHVYVSPDTDCVIVRHEVVSQGAVAAARVSRIG